MRLQTTTKILYFNYAPEKLSLAQSIRREFFQSISLQAIFEEMKLNSEDNHRVTTYLRR
jgi:hypothetical protein